MKKTILNVMMGVFSAMAMVACGSSGGGGGGTGTTAVVPYGQQCPVGQVSTQHGCLAVGAQCQGPQAGWGWHPTYGCVQPMYNGYGQNGACTMQYPNYCPQQQYPGWNQYPYYVPYQQYQHYYPRYGSNWYWVWYKTAQRDGKLGNYKRNPNVQ